MEAARIATGIARYGLNSNPYVPRPLDPLNREERLRTDLSGGGKLAEAERYIERAYDANEPSFVLVSGKSGAGRTSIANHLLRHYRDHVGKAGLEKFVVPKSHYSGEDAHDIFKKWVTSLHGLLKRRGLTPLGREGFDFDDELSTKRNLVDDDYATYLTNLLPALVEVLRAKNAAFGVCFENVKDYRLVEAAFEAFADTPTLVVLTVLEYPRTADSIILRFERQRADASTARDGYPVVELETIRGRGARELVEYHWDLVQPEIESPFDPTGLMQAFDDRSRTAGRVLQLTERVLSVHAATVGEGPLWPDARDQLMFQRDLLERLVPEMDKTVPERV